jgi:hypothetical protein
VTPSSQVIKAALSTVIGSAVVQILLYGTQCWSALRVEELTCRSSLGGHRQVPILPTSCCWCPTPGHLADK